MELCSSKMVRHRIWTQEHWCFSTIEYQWFPDKLLGSWIIHEEQGSNSSLVSEKEHQRFGHSHGRHDENQQLAQFHCVTTKFSRQGTMKWYQKTLLGRSASYFFSCFYPIIMPGHEIEILWGRFRAFISKSFQIFSNFHSKFNKNSELDFNCLILATYSSRPG